MFTDELNKLTTISQFAWLLLLGIFDIASIITYLTKNTRSYPNLFTITTCL